MTARGRGHGWGLGPIARRVHQVQHWLYCQIVDCATVQKAVAHAVLGEHHLTDYEAVCEAEAAIWRLVATWPAPFAAEFSLTDEILITVVCGIKEGGPVDDVVELMFAGGDERQDLAYMCRWETGHDWLAERLGLGVSV